MFRNFSRKIWGPHSKTTLALNSPANKLAAMYLSQLTAGLEQLAPLATPSTLTRLYGRPEFSTRITSSTPRFRHMVPRYFRAHNFYQDAVREGRDVLFGASMVLLAALGAAAGMTAYVVLQAVRREEAFVALFRGLPGWLQQLTLTLLAEPWGLIALCGVCYALVLVLWSGLLAVLSRRRYTLVGAQGRMLALWPRWPLLLVMAASMAVAGMPPAVAVEAALLLAAAWLAITLYALLRTLYDYTSVTRVPFWVPALLLVLNPLALAAVAVLVFVLQDTDRAAFLWHLATRV